MHCLKIKTPWTITEWVGATGPAFIAWITTWVAALGRWNLRNKRFLHLASFCVIVIQPDAPPKEGAPLAGPVHLLREAPPWRARWRGRHGAQRKPPF